MPPAPTPTAAAPPTAWRVLIGATLTMVCYGGIYAWSLLVPSLMQSGYSALQTQLVFGTVVLALAACTLVAGPLMERVGPRPVAMGGALLYALGYGVTSLAEHRFALLWLGAGLLVGLGTGAGYITTVASAIRWWPGRRGLVTGIVLGLGYGSGAILAKELFQGLLALGWEPAAIFRLLAAGYGSLMLLLAGLLCFPSASTASNRPPARPAFAVLRQKRFWQMFLAFFFGNLPGLMVIGSLGSLGERAGLSAATAALAISVLAIGNGLGRVGWGWLFDRFEDDRPTRMALVIVIGSVMALMAALVLPETFRPAGFLLAGLLVGLGFASCLVLHAAQTARCYGADRVGSVYPLIFQAHGLGALIGPALGGWSVDRTGDDRLALGLALISAVLALTCYVALGRSHPHAAPASLS